MYGQPSDSQGQDMRQFIETQNKIIELWNQRYEANKDNWENKPIIPPS